MSAGAVAGAVVQGAGSVASAVGQYLVGSRANEIEEMNLEFQRGAYEQNYQNMVEQQAYARGLQERVFEREDSAVQRRVADLEAAGLSPTLAAGSAAGSGSVVPATVPRREAPQRGVQSKMMQISALGQIANIGRTLAEASLMGAQAEVASKTVESKVSEAEAAAYVAKLDAKYKHDLELYLASKFAEQGETGRFIDLTPEVRNYMIMEEDLKRKGSEAKVAEKEAELYTANKAISWIVPLLRLLK